MMERDTPEDQQHIKKQEITVVQTAKRERTWLIVTKDSQIAESITQGDGAQALVQEVEEMRADGRFETESPQLLRPQTAFFVDRDGVTVKNKEVATEDFARIEEEFNANRTIFNGSTSSLEIEPTSSYGSAEASMASSEILVDKPRKQCQCRCVILRGIGGVARDSTSESRR